MCTAGHQGRDEGRVGEWEEEEEGDETGEESGEEDSSIDFGEDGEETNFGIDNDSISSRGEEGTEDDPEIKASSMEGDDEEDEDEEEDSIDCLSGLFEASR